MVLVVCSESQCPLEFARKIADKVFLDVLILQVGAWLLYIANFRTDTEPVQNRVL